MPESAEDPELLRMAAFFASTSLGEMLRASLEVADELGLSKVAAFISAACDALEEDFGSAANVN